MNKFKIGDIVKVVRDYEEGNTKNMIGTVVFIEDDEDDVAPYLVDLGDGFNGHTGDRNYHKSTCWWFSNLDLQLIESKRTTGKYLVVDMDNFDIYTSTDLTDLQQIDHATYYYDKADGLSEKVQKIIDDYCTMEQDMFIDEFKED